MAIRSTNRGGYGAGRGDNPHGVTNVNAYSAATRKAKPISSGEYNSSISAGEYPNTAAGSKASYNVSNSGGHRQGEGMSMVRNKYRESRKSGMSPDASRGAALNPYSYPSGTGPGGRQGPSINMATDYEGKSL